MHGWARCYSVLSPPVGFETGRFLVGRFKFPDIPKIIKVVAEAAVEIFAKGPKDGLMQPEITVIDIIGAVGRRVPAEAISYGGVVEKAPVSNDIVSVAFCPDIGLDGKNDLVVLGIGYAGQDRGKVGLATLAGVEGEIRAEHSGKSGLEGIAGDGKSGDVELAFFLLDGIEPAGVVALEERPAEIHQIELVIRLMQAILCCSPEGGHGQEE